MFARNGVFTSAETIASRVYGGRAAPEDKVRQMIKEGRGRIILLKVSGRYQHFQSTVDRYDAVGKRIQVYLEYWYKQ